MEFLGCNPSKKDLRNYKIRATASQIDNLPDEFELPKYSFIKNQGSVGSCVPHVISEILEYHNHGQNKLSTNFLYGIKRELCDDLSQGMYLSDACKIATKYGDMLESDCPGNVEIPHAWYEAESAYANVEKMERAYTFRLSSYFTCKTNNDIKVALQNYGPVAACIDWYQGCRAKNDGTFIYNIKRKSTYHCIMIYGWNKNGFLCQNSFGKSWGNEGCFILPYDYTIGDARALVDEYNPEEEALIIPKTNKFLDFWYKILNWFINLVN